MKMLMIGFTLFLNSLALAQEKMKFNFPDEDIVKIIDIYAKATNAKIVMDSTVRGKITILNPGEITQEEALNQLSEGLAINGFSMNKRDDYYVIRNARSAQRDALEISTSLPSLKPQRMATWIVTLKNISAAELRNQFGRMISSSYGEIEYNRKSNQLMISDFTSALHRVNSILLEFDRTEDPRMNKLAEESRRVEEKLKAAAPKNEDSTEKLSDIEIKLKKKPAEKTGATSTAASTTSAPAETKPTPEASSKKDN